MEYILSNTAFLIKLILVVKMFFIRLCPVWCKNIGRFFANDESKRYEHTVTELIELFQLYGIKIV